MYLRAKLPGEHLAAFRGDWERAAVIYNELCRLSALRGRKRPAPNLLGEQNTVDGVLVAGELGLIGEVHGVAAPLKRGQQLFTCNKTNEYVKVVFSVISPGKMFLRFFFSNIIVLR